METRIQSVREEIQSAFAGAPQPARNEIIRMDRSLEKALNDPDRQEWANKMRKSMAETEELYSGLNAQHISMEFLRQHWGSTVYFTAKAHRYYLPTLLLAGLDDLPADGDMTHTALFSIRPDYESLYDEGYSLDTNEKDKALTLGEYRAVCSFLELLYDQIPAYKGNVAEAVRWRWNGHAHSIVEKSNAYFKEQFNFSGYSVHPVEVREKLARTIYQAFDGTPYPGDKNLIKNPSHCDEEAELAIHFAGQNWRRLHPDFLNNHYEALSFFTPEGFRYILPAFLILDVQGKANQDPVFHITDGLFPKDNYGQPLKKQPKKSLTPQELEPYAISKFKPFTAVERQAIIAYLEFVRDQDPFNKERIDQAIQNYWNQSTG